MSVVIFAFSLHRHVVMQPNSRTVQLTDGSMPFYTSLYTRTRLTALKITLLYGKFYLLRIWHLPKRQQSVGIDTTMTVMSSVDLIQTLLQILHILTHGGYRLLR
jgi:hypothetical protein